MRWLKHLTKANRDERMTRLIDECGIEGYGFYWLLVELVGEGWEKDGAPQLTYSLPQWSRLLYSHHNKVSKMVGKLQVIGLIETSNADGRLTVIIPKLLKYRDEYSKKSGHTPVATPDSVSTSTRERERERESVEGEKATAAELPGAKPDASPSPKPENPPPPEPDPDPPAELAEALAELNPDGLALARLWQACREADPDCTPPEVAHCTWLKARSMGQSVKNPWGLLLRYVPEAFRAGGNAALRAFRRQGVRATPAFEPSAEQQAFERWLSARGLDPRGMPWPDYERLLLEFEAGRKAVVA